MAARKRGTGNQNRTRGETKEKGRTGTSTVSTRSHGVEVASFALFVYSLFNPGVRCWHEISHFVEFINYGARPVSAHAARPRRHP